mmetsp:Transcript_83092/g.178115  ORF Transcript_83092/g.178115 Transcript_83092/m.178115 type:complete len:252 (-) Transcript_83092:194-949(-)
MPSYIDGLSSAPAALCLGTAARLAPLAWHRLCLLGRLLGVLEILHHATLLILEQGAQGVIVVIVLVLVRCVVKKALHLLKLIRGANLHRLLRLLRGHRLIVLLIPILILILLPQRPGEELCFRLRLRLCVAPELPRSLGLAQERHGPRLLKVLGQRQALHQEHVSEGLLALEESTQAATSAEEAVQGGATDLLDGLGEEPPTFRGVVVEVQSAAPLTSAGSPADAVQMCDNVLGEVKLHDATHIGDVDTPT